MTNMGTAERISDLLGAAMTNAPVIRVIGTDYVRGTALAIKPTPALDDDSFMTSADPVENAYLMVRGANGMMFWRISELIEDLRVGRLVINPATQTGCSPGARRGLPFRSRLSPVTDAIADGPYLEQARREEDNDADVMGADLDARQLSEAHAIRRRELAQRAFDARTGRDLPLYQTAALSLCDHMTAELTGTVFADWPMLRGPFATAMIRWITSQGVDPSAPGPSDCPF